MAYTTTLQCVRVCGIGVEIVDENVGTGNNSATSFDLDNGNVIAGSYSLYYGATGSNTMTTLTETTHYTLDKDSGRIILTSAGVTALSTNILYAKYLYSPKMSDTIINTYLTSADKEIERKTGNYWGTETSTTEYFDGRNSLYPTTDEPYIRDWDEPSYVMLKNKGITEITSVDFIQKGIAVPTTESIPVYAVDYNPETGKLVFLNNTLPNGTRNIKIVYKHGYASVDPQIAELAAYITGLRIFSNITGGSYDDMTGFTIGRKQVQIGEVYVNVREVVKQFEERIQQIYDSIGRNSFAC